MNTTKTLLSLNNCKIEDSQKTVLERVDWTMQAGEAWLVIGPNGGGKSDFLSALAEKRSIIPNTPEKGEAESSFYNFFEHKTSLVSLEKAADIITEERNRDESDYIEGGVDHGRTGRLFLYEAKNGTLKPNEKPTKEIDRIETYPEVKLCGVEKILDRGLKYMSTGEIRRTLLCAALFSGKKLLILSDPFAGLDAESRKILFDFFNFITGKQTSAKESFFDYPCVILGMERYTEIPSSITNVIEFMDGKVSFCGTKTEYEKLAEKRNNESYATKAEEKEVLKNEINSIDTESENLTNRDNLPEELIVMKNVNVGWDGKYVLSDLTWTLHRGEHWLIRGPNGSGKTTFLELITGDNMQVFSNDISLFGARRGSGESVWDIKHKLGIVSYRLHVEYRMVGGTSLESVIISGFHDSIGLYEQKTDIEKSLAEKWLNLGGFEGRGDESFNNLSYGEQRAILILRAVVKKPAVMILDEPCHGLDEENRFMILNLLETIAASGTTTFLHVTHDPTEVLPCEKHILELHPGEKPMYQIVATGA